MNLNACHANQLKTLTGCSAAVLALLESRLRVGMQNKRGPPYRHSLWTMPIVTLMKLRLQLSYRALSAFTGIGYVTLSRIVLRIWNAEWTALRPTITATVLGDKAYTGADGEHVVLQRPVDGNGRLYRQRPYEARIWNNGINTLRVRIEHVFARIKSFAILANTFPLYRSKLGIVVRAVAVIYNCIIELKSADAL